MGIEELTEYGRGHHDGVWASLEEGLSNIKRQRQRIRDKIIKCNYNKDEIDKLIEFLK